MMIFSNFLNIFLTENSQNILENFLPFHLRRQDHHAIYCSFLYSNRNDDVIWLQYVNIISFLNGNSDFIDQLMF